MTRLTVFIPFLLSLSALAQTSGSIVHLGYQAARPALVAPGQVLHLTLHGLTTTFDSTQAAQAVPLPTDFHGLSVSLQRTGNSQPELLPLLRGDSSSSCDGGAPAALTAPANRVLCPVADGTFDLWVQIPYDLSANSPGADNTACVPAPCSAGSLNLNDAVLTVTEKSGTATSFRIVPVIDQIHLINSCTDNIGPVGLVGISGYASYPCLPLITHLDGSVVTANTPARQGEELVAYAYGLGVPAATVQAVNATPPDGAFLSRIFRLSFTGVAATGTSPDYVGLVGGQVGLYQVNFRVPSVPQDLPPCIGQLGNPALLPVNPANLTMVLGGTASMDQASFCVQP